MTKTRSNPSKKRQIALAFSAAFCMNACSAGGNDDSSTAQGGGSRAGENGTSMLDGGTSASSGGGRLGTGGTVTGGATGGTSLGGSGGTVSGGSGGTSSGGSGGTASGGSGGTTSGGAGGTASGGSGGTVTACGTFDFSAVAQHLQTAVTTNQVNGAGLIIVRPGCPILYRSAVGNQTEGSVLEMASASKVPAVTLMMTLVDEGKISLDDPVKKFLPDWPSDKSAVTVRHLLSHTSGLPGNAACIGQADASLETCATEIAALPLSSVPGSAFRYGGVSFQVAGRIAEVVSGKSWNQLFDLKLRKPCGLAVMGYEPSASNALGSATNPRIAGGAASNLTDYGILLMALMGDGKCGENTLLSAAAVAEMRRDQIANAKIVSSPEPDDWHYGLGWWLEPPANSPPFVSDPGAFGAYPWIDLSNNYGAFLLIKKQLQVGTTLVNQLRPIIAKALAK